MQLSEITAKQFLKKMKDPQREELKQALSVIRKGMKEWNPEFVIDKATIKRIIQQGEKLGWNLTFQIAFLKDNARGLSRNKIMWNSSKMLQEMIQDLLKDAGLESLNVVCTFNNKHALFSVY